MKAKRKGTKAFLNIREAADMIGFSTATCHAWAECGYLEGFCYHANMRGTWRFRRETVERLMASAYRGRPETGAEQPSQ